MDYNKINPIFVHINIFSVNTTKHLALSNIPAWLRYIYIFNPISKLYRDNFVVSHCTQDAPGPLFANKDS